MRRIIRDGKNLYTPKWKNGFGVFTRPTESLERGHYFTALFDADLNIYGVEGYKDFRSSLRGHKKWSKKVKTIKEIRSVWEKFIVIYK